MSKKNNKRAVASGSSDQSTLPDTKRSKNTDTKLIVANKIESRENLGQYLIGNAVEQIIKDDNKLNKLFGKNKLFSQRTSNVFVELKGMITGADANDKLAALAVAVDFKADQLSKEIKDSSTYNKYTLIKLFKTINSKKISNETKQQIITALEQVADSQSLFNFTKDFIQHLINVNQKKLSNNNIEWSNRRFDALSRLIAIDSACSAACFDGEQILFAFNEVFESKGNKKDIKDNKYYRQAKKVIDYLKLFIDNPNLNQNDEHIKNTRIELITQAAESSYKIMTNQDPSQSKLKAILRELDKEYGQINDDNNQLKEKFALADTDYLTSVIRARRDLDKLSEALDSNNLVENVEKKIFFDKIIKAFKEDNYQIVTTGEQENKCHAEMRITEYLLNKDQHLQAGYYIGLSKLCCTDCYLVIKGSEAGFIINNDKDKKITLSTRGNHGEGFEWLLIDQLRNDNNLSLIIGNNAMNRYDALSNNDKQLALDNILRYVNKITLNNLQESLRVDNKNSEKNRSQLADLSDSQPEEDNNQINKNKAIDEFVSEQIEKLKNNNNNVNKLGKITNSVINKCMELNNEQEKNIILNKYLEEISDQIFVDSEDYVKACAKNLYLIQQNQQLLNINPENLKLVNRACKMVDTIVNMKYKSKEESRDIQK